ncbi:hypothetical protein GCM10023219_23730 [Stakelama sediminis]|uniref:Phytoene synthase n=1 Tax=Stakelama sediminis TaxID=463200 RepID=A0A840YZL3_9SPHN|nr:squalene/phytoene synthase family protein [Stakelama sediminis]MBB5718950.1 phytoene synthase [Stakelama sediminis]
MVNAAETNEGAEKAGPEHPERTLILSYARAGDRDGMAVLLELDDLLGNILRSTSEPMLGQMRLTWWRDSLNAIDEGKVAAVPLLQQLAARFDTIGAAAATLAPVAEGWAVLLEEDALPDEALGRYASGRGGALFRSAAILMGRGDFPALEEAGQGWALADLSRNVRDASIADPARNMAQPLLDRALAQRWPRPLRALGAMAHLARLDLAAGSGSVHYGAPHRVWRALRHRITGR